MGYLYLLPYRIVSYRKLATTVVVESVEVDAVGGVAQVDERLAVGPALNDDATRLRVEREQSAVEVARRVHDATEPPAHAARVMHVRPVQRRVVLGVEAGRAAAKY